MSINGIWLNNASLMDYMSSSYNGTNRYSNNIYRTLGKSYNITDIAKAQLPSYAQPAQKDSVTASGKEFVKAARPAAEDLAASLKKLTARRI